VHSPSQQLYPDHGLISPTCLRAAFKRKDSISAKTQLSLFVLLGNAGVKVARKMLVKLTPS